MRRALILLTCLLLAGAGAYWWQHPHTQASATTQPAAPEAIPVLVAAAETQDVPIYLEGLGTVQASATVTVKPMVDGPLIEVRFREGQDVRVGDVLARIDPRAYQAALDQAVAKKKQDEATLANARLDVARYAKLAATAYTSQQQYDTARSTVAQLEAQVQSDQAQIDSARTQLSYTTIASPIDGRVGFRQVDAGNIVHAGDSVGLAVLTTLRPILVQFTLPQQSLPEIAAAMAEGAPEVLALPQNADAAPQHPVLDRGTLTVLDNQVDPATGTIRLRARFANDRLTLWPGAFVTVRLRVATSHDATVVPPVAVQRGPLGAYLYVVNADQTVSRRAVKIGHEDVLTAIVTAGLQPGERVVVDGASRLTDGAKVAIVQPTGTPASPLPATASGRAPGAT